MTRRQEKVARVVKEAVSDAIANHLNDPRIEGFVSVTKIEMSPNLRNAEVYISIFGGDEVVQSKTFIAINHSRTKIQSLLSERIKSKFCPILHFHRDEEFKKTIETMRLIDEAASEYKPQDSDEQEKNEES